MRTLGIGAAIVVLLAAACYLLSPFMTLRTLAQAARDGDRDRLAIAVDFPAIRSGFKDQINAFIAKKALGGHASPLNGLAVLLGPMIVDRAVDAFVTPDGVAAMLQRPARNSADANARHGTTYLWKGHVAFLDLDHLRMTYPIDNDTGQLALLLERRGVFTWKLARIDLPLDEIAAAASAKPLQPKTTQSPGIADMTADRLPATVGQCGETHVKQVMTRLEEQDGTPVAGSGSAIAYSNGGYQVSYDQLPQVDTARPGDGVRLCLVSVPKNCPPGDDRGRVYHAVDHRTHQEWMLADAEHSCGGA